ncbi:hypothetical protein ACS1UX_004801, partial [Salmonella enterica subsp. enterica serovar Infantis]
TQACQRVGSSPEERGFLSGCTDTGRGALQEGWLTWSATFLSLKYLNDPACRRTVVINDFGQ